MIYIISGNEPILIDFKIEEIIKNNTDADIVKMDAALKNFSVQDLINTCTDVGLFSLKKLILVKEPYFFIKKSDEKEMEKLAEYCSHPIYETDLVFYTMENVFNERLKIFKDVLKNAQHIKLNQYKAADFSNECISLMNKRKIKMARGAYNVLLNACNNSLSIFNQNLDVLELYPDQIDEEVVKSLLISSDEVNTFDLINAICAKNLEKALMLVDKILMVDENVNGLIALLASQLRFLYEVAYYNAKGDKINAIMDKVNTKSRYRIEKALETLANLKKKEILSLLNKLAEIDLRIKTSSDLSQRMLFELFIVKMIKNEKN
ncbi:MAG: DNA polymerase III subunit delta [Erysipelotrichaceae bacterium]|nr:DNA polymerase III subunit delta [Erysipelotrichaceae bacterium]